MHSNDHHNHHTNSGIDAQALRDHLLDLYDAYAHLRCPHRLAMDTTTSRPQFGPREPVAASVLDAEAAVERGLLTLYRDTRAEYSFECPPLSADPKRYPRPSHTTRPTVPALVTWLHDHAHYVVLATTDPQLWYIAQLVKATRQMAGMTSTGETYTALARTVVDAAAEGSEVWLSSYRAAALLTAMGIPTSRRAIARWGRQAHVDVKTDEESGAPRYKAVDVIRHAKQLTSAAATAHEDEDTSHDATGDQSERTSELGTIDPAQTGEEGDP